MIKIDPSSPGAVYRRVSTDKQDALRQKNSTNRWLERHHLSVPNHRIYEDIGWSRADAHRRPAFQRLIRDAEAGRVRWIVIDRHDRFETADKFELFAYLHRLRKAHCRLFTVDDKELTSNERGDSLNTHLNSDESERELREKSVRILEEKVRLAKEGRWLGAKVPYGFDVVAFTKVGRTLQEQWRVQFMGPHARVKIDKLTNLKRHYNGKNNFPPAANDEFFQLRPTTDVKKLEHVRKIFQKFHDESISEGALSRQLNIQELPPPSASRWWTQGHIRDMLRNPAYIGLPVWNRLSSSDYFEWTGGERVEKEPGSKTKRHDKRDWIMPDQPLFTPIVEPKLWHAVQKKIEARPASPRRSRPNIYFLSGLVHCGNCGGLMTGSRMPRKKKPTTDHPPTYLCSTYNNWKGDRSRCPCRAYRIYQDQLEKHLLEYLNKTGHQLQEFAVVSHTSADQRPEAINQAVKKYFDSYARMIERLGGAIIESNDGKNAWIEVPLGGHIAKVLHGSAHLRIKPNDWKAVADLYMEVFRKDEKALRQEVAALDKQHSDLLRTIGRLPKAATLAIEKTTVELAQIEQQIAAAKEKLTNASIETAQSVEEVDEMLKDWRVAEKSLSHETCARRKAEAVRHVLDKIVVTFKPNVGVPVGTPAVLEFFGAGGCVKQRLLTPSR